MNQWADHELRSAECCLLIRQLTPHAPPGSEGAHGSADLRPYPAPWGALFLRPVPTAPLATLPQPPTPNRRAFSSASRIKCTSASVAETNSFMTALIRWTIRPPSPRLRAPGGCGQKSLLQIVVTISHGLMSMSGRGAGAPGSKAPAGPRWNTSAPGTRMYGWWAGVHGQRARPDRRLGQISDGQSPYTCRNVCERRREYVCKAEGHRILHITAGTVSAIENSNRCKRAVPSSAPEYKQHDRLQNWDQWEVLGNETVRL